MNGLQLKLVTLDRMIETLTIHCAKYSRSSPDVDVVSNWTLLLVCIVGALGSMVHCSDFGFEVKDGTYVHGATVWAAKWGLLATFVLRYSPWWCWSGCAHWNISLHIHCISVHCWPFGSSMWTESTHSPRYTWNNNQTHPRIKLQQWGFLHSRQVFGSSK